MGLGLELRIAHTEPEFETTELDWDPECLNVDQDPRTSEWGSCSGNAWIRWGFGVARTELGSGILHGRA